VQRPQGVRMVPVPAARHSRARARATPFGSRTRFSSSSRPPSQAHPPVHSPTEAGLTSVVSAKDLQPPPRHCVPHRSSVVAPAPPRLGAADKAQNPQARPSSRAAKGHQGRPASDEFGAVRRESNRDHRPRLDAGCLSPQCPASSAARRSREGAGSFRRKSVRGARGVPRRTQRALHLTVCPTPEPAHTPHARGHFERTAPTVREGIRDQCVACWALPRHRSPR